MALSVTGWTDAYLSEYPTVSYTEERKRALVERIKQRRYNFTYDAHQTLPAAAPFYSDGVLCVLTKQQWDDAMNEAYKEIPRGARLMPMDIITRPLKKSVLYEKEKYEPKEE